MNKPKCVINSDGTKVWLLNGRLHRADGPAIEFIDGTKHWYLNGEHYCCSWWLPFEFAKGFVRWIEDAKKL